jgi:hypothetical protein
MVAPGASHAGDGGGLDLPEADQIQGRKHGADGAKDLTESPVTEGREDQEKEEKGQLDNHSGL